MTEVVLTPLEGRIFKLLQKGSFTLKELGEVLDLTPGCISYYLTQLRKKNLIVSSGNISKDMRSNVYFVVI